MLDIRLRWTTNSAASLRSKTARVSVSAYSTLFIVVVAVIIYIVEKKIGLSKLY